jgi:transitional endoplasmic reticulum ATPase
MNARVSTADLERARGLVRPSAGRHSLVTVSTANPAEVVGLESQRTWLRRIAAERFSIERGEGRLPGGVLLFGPPGSGKTLLVHALAAELKPSFVVIRGPEIFSKWLGDTEEAIRHIFELARRMPPAIVFFDQLEAIAPVRGADRGSGTADRVVGQLLTELDQLGGVDRVLVVGATNRPDLIDPSVLRAGRLGLHIEITLPSLDERRAEIELFCRDVGVALDSVDTTWLASETAGYSGADLRTLAGILALRRSSDEPAVHQDLRRELVDAMARIRPAHQPTESALQRSSR